MRGKNIEKKTKTINGRVCGVMAFILDENNNLLLLQRNDNKKWEPVKGGVLENETKEKAVVREIKEETGLEAKNPQKILEVLDELKTSYGKTKICGSVWLCQIKREQQIFLTEEHCQYQWVPWHSVENMNLHPPIVNLIKEKISKIILKTR